MSSIIFDLISLGLLFVLTLTNHDRFFIIMGIMAIVAESIKLGIDYYDYTKNEKIRGFEVVSDKNKKNNGIIKLPQRATKSSMAYDFYAPQDYEVKPNDIVKIWTDVKSYMQEDEGLILNVRSSMGGKFMLANTQGWIDSDYYNNEKNDGNIGIFLKNITDEVIYIKNGEAIAQGMFVKYLKSDNGNTKNVRKGGFGSTNN